MIAAIARHDIRIAGFFDKFPSPEIDITPWLYGFLVLAVAQAIMFLISQGFMLVIVYSAGRQMFEAVLTRIAGATFRFYDVTVSIVVFTNIYDEFGTLACICKLELAVIIS